MRPRQPRPEADLRWILSPEFFLCVWVSYLSGFCMQNILLLVIRCFPPQTKYSRALTAIRDRAEKLLKYMGASGVVVSQGERAGQRRRSSSAAGSQGSFTFHHRATPPPPTHYRATLPQPRILITLDSLYWGVKGHIFTV